MRLLPAQGTDSATASTQQRCIKEVQAPDGIRFGDWWTSWTISENLPIHQQIQCYVSYSHRCCFTSQSIDRIYINTMPRPNPERKGAHDIESQGSDISCDTRKQNTYNMSVSNNRLTGFTFGSTPGKKNNNGQSVDDDAHVRHVLVSSQGLFWICTIQRTWTRAAEGAVRMAFN